MKKYIIPFFAIGALLLLSSCGATEQLVLNTMEPSPVTLSGTITKIGIVDRTEQVNATIGDKKIDRILAAEERWLSENGTDAAISGLFDELLKDERFEIVKILDSVPSGMKEIGANPSDIQWSSVQELCEKNDVDAIFSLAYYEADTKVSLKKTKMPLADMMREKKEVAAQELTLETLIENGWRIYDPKKQELIDEIVFNNQIISTGKGETATLAYRAIDDRRAVMLEKSKTNGATYGQRLLPSKSEVYRHFYVKGSSKLALAGENVLAGNWEEAIALWEQEAQSTNAKIKSRAYHNLAIASERAENLNKALTWATMAFEVHAEEMYREYMNTLQERIEKQPLLEKQLAKMDFSN